MRPRPVAATPSAREVRGGSGAAAARLNVGRERGPQRLRPQAPPPARRFRSDGSQMSINRRVVAVSALLGVMALAGVLLLQSHAQASSHFNVSKLNPIQRRLLSGFLSTALAPTTSS